MSSLPYSLFQLEEIDSRIEADQATIESLQERLAGDQDIVVAERRLADLEKRAVALETRQRRLEGTVEDATVTMDRLNKTLYSGAIHDSREMASVEKEIGHAGIRRSQAEDELLEAMEASDKLQSEVTGARDRVLLLKEKRSQSLGSMRDDLSRLRQEIDALRRERVDMAAGIDGSQVQRYERLRARHRHAVSHVQNDICQWCRVQIPRSDLQHARSGALVTCTNCSRILYVDAAT
jgi:predicted  nucleic acid-binding Zn-ribbon protein